MSMLDNDKLILEELKMRNIDGLSKRGKVAIKELADLNEGAIIFLFLSLNSRIRDLEEMLIKTSNDKTIH